MYQQPPRLPDAPRPESHFESAQDANDIYELYGRESIYGAWDDSAQRVITGARGPEFRRPSPSPLRQGEQLADEMEELGEPTRAFGEQPDFSRPSSRGPDFSEPTVYQDWQSNRDSEYSETYLEDQSMGGLAGVAGITLTVSPSLSDSPSPKTRAAGLSPIALAGTAFNGTPSEPPTPSRAPGTFSEPPSPIAPVSSIPARFREQTHMTPERHYSLSPSSSNSSSPVHPSISRIYSQRNGSPGSDTQGASGANSNASLVSSQYPGEDPDAFHVRSTYARLEVEGVYGDGWDEGIERTRGGLSQSQSRVTMVYPDKDEAMSEQERRFLSSLDRYGFVDTPTRSRSEGRLALLPAAAFGKVPKLQMRSSLGGNRPTTPTPPSVGRPNAPPPPSPSVPAEKRNDITPKARRKEVERVEKWMRMMSVGKRDKGGNIIAWRWSSNGEGAKHPTRIYKGIPDRWRMAAWWTLAEEKAAKAPRTPSPESLESDYLARREGPSENDVQIDLDVPRTISGHALFKTRFGHGQRALFHVLHAFSMACGTCGYCQGMGSIAATLLCYFEPERAYTLLVRLHDLYDMHGIFAPGFPGLLETFYVQERLLECLMPDVYESFKTNMISSSAWGAKIYITLFVNVVPFNTQLRLWDAMFLDGYDVMVMAVLAILWAYRPLLAAPGANFESILSLLSSYYVPEDEDAMLTWMRKMLWTPGTRERIAFWRREWKGLVERGQSDGLLL